MKNAEKLDPSKELDDRFLIHPPTAEKWLATFNTNNRRLRPSWVNYLAAQMLSGEWRQDHPDPIIFASARWIMDGQHRLHAGVKAAIPFASRIVGGADESLREYIDTGLARALEDRVQLDKSQQVNKLLVHVINGLFQMQHKAGERIKPTPKEAHQLFLGNEQSFRFAANFLGRHLRAITVVAVAAALCEFHMRQPKLAEEFTDSLLTPDGLMQPGRMLRDWLLLGGTGITLRGKIYEGTVFCAIAAIKGQDVKQVRRGNWTDLGVIGAQK